MLKFLTTIFLVACAIQCNFSMHAAYILRSNHKQTTPPVNMKKLYEVMARVRENEQLRANLAALKARKAAAERQSNWYSPIDVVLEESRQRAYPRVTSRDLFRMTPKIKRLLRSIARTDDSRMPIFVHRQ